MHSLTSRPIVTKARSLLRIVLIVALWCYAFGLAAYLILRVVIGDGVWWLAWLNNFAPYYFLPLIIGLPLALLLRRKYLSLMHLILVGIAIIWLLPRFLGNRSVSSMAASGQVLKIVTFNVWGDNPRLDDVQTWLREMDADLVLLQEIPPAWAGVGIPELTDMYPYQISQPLEVRAWGDAILSRYPILTHERYDLYNGFTANDRITIEWNERSLAVYNIHLSIPQRDTPYFTLPINNPFLNMLLKYDDERRNRQIDLLLDRLAAEDHAFIVAGDFNMSDNTVKYGEITAQFHDSYRESGWGMGATWPNNRVAGFSSFVPPVLRIDYVWHSNAFRSLSAITGPELGSDHYPLVTVLQWNDSN